MRSKSEGREAPLRDRLAEERSIAFHREVTARLEKHPELLERARARVRRWLEEGVPHPDYAREWARVLELPASERARAMVDPGEEMRALRQVTPFAGALPPKERWAIWAEVARAHGRST